mgnify:CR=1 FL=1
MDVTLEVLGMSATADLRSEHVDVGRMLAIMDAMAERVRAGDRPDSGQLAEGIEFLRVFVDKCHHTKEQQLLFPALRTANVRSVDEVLEVLLADHVHGRETVARIAAAAQRPSDEDAANAELAAAMADYTALLHAHIRREENDCFDVADRELPIAVQDELAVGYARIERDVLGEGVHEGFHALLARLARTYHA